MDILILGGGYGTRLFGNYVSKTYYPKGLVEVGHKPCIEHALGAFSDGLISKIFLETNNEGKIFYEHWLETSKYKDKTELLVEPISTPQNCLKILETIDYISDNVRFEKPILVLSPDNFFTKNQDDMIKGYDGGVRIATYTVPTLNDARKYGVATINSGKITSCVEKPTQPQSQTIRTSCEIWDSVVFALLHKWNTKHDANKVGNFINYLITEKVDVRSYPVKGFWIDIGDPKSLEEARANHKRSR